MSQTNRRRAFGFLALFLASVLASTAVYVNLFSLSEGAFYQLLLFKPRTVIFDPEKITCDDDLPVGIATKVHFASGDDLARVLLEDLNASSPNSAQCGQFDVSEEGRNCSCFIESGYRHKWSFKPGELLDLRRVLLISHFNFPNYQAAAKVEALYSGMFADILFCGPSNNDYPFWSSVNSTNGTDALSWLPYNSSKFMHYGSKFHIDRAHMFYRCLELATKARNTSVYEGILLMSDDMILNLWRLRATGKRLDKNWMMLHDPGNIFEIDHGSFCRNESSSNKLDCFREDVGWGWTVKYRQNLLRMYETLEELSGDYANHHQSDEELLGPDWDKKLPDLDPTKRNFWRWIRLSLAAKAGGKRRMFGRASADCFYVTQRYVKAAVNFFRLQQQYGVFVEIAVGTVMRAISLEGDLQLLDISAHDWGQDRTRPITKTYGTRFDLVHPFKMSRIYHFNHTADRCIYCHLLKLNHIYATLVRKPCLLSLVPNKILRIPPKPQSSLY